MCVSLVEIYPKRLAAVIAAKVGSTMYRLRGVNTIAHHSFLFLFVKKKIKDHESFSFHFHYAPLCVGLSHKIPIK